MTFKKSQVSSTKILHIKVIPSGAQLYISRIKDDLILSTVVHRNLFFSSKNFDHLRQLFVIYY